VIVQPELMVRESTAMASAVSMVPKRKRASLNLD
jgi:hypothetical protein